MKYKKKSILSTTLVTVLASSLFLLFFTSCSYETNTSTSETVITPSTQGKMNATDLFTARDLTQTADTSQATFISVNDGQEISITEGGTYVITGQASDATIIIKAKSNDNVQLILNNVILTNRDTPCIHSKKAQNVIVTLVGNNALSVTHPFAADMSSHIDSVIFSKTNLICNGTGSLTINSSENGIVCKDDLKITGGTYSITAASKSIQANDSVRIADGTFILTAGTDGIHVENNDNDTLGYLYIGGGSFTVRAGDDALHATSLIQIDDGELEITAKEGMEGTYIQINDGNLRIHAQDDGINAAHKSTGFTPTAEINGGLVIIRMDSGDGDAIDSNGNIIIRGGTVEITAGSSFDYDGSAWFNGGKVIVNGQQLDAIPHQS